MRTKKRLTIRPEPLLAIGCHAAMGVSLGVAFALIVTIVPCFGFTELLSHSDAPWTITLAFLGVAASMFGIGAALTGSILEDS